MTTKQKARMALGLTLFTPLLLVEEGLKKCGVSVSNKGLAHNSEGKSISEIWTEAGDPDSHATH